MTSAPGRNEWIASHRALDPLGEARRRRVEQRLYRPLA
jgi:hypothetical protein